MSRDIFVQDIPADITSVDQIPDDFQPRAFIVTRAGVIAAVRAEAPGAAVRNDGWMTIEAPGKYSVEVNIAQDQEELDGFAFHVRGDSDADHLIARILGRLQLRAFDPANDSGLFEVPTE